MTVFGLWIGWMVVGSDKHNCNKFHHQSRSIEWSHYEIDEFFFFSFYYLRHWHFMRICWRKQMLHWHVSAGDFFFSVLLERDFGFCWSIRKLVNYWIYCHWMETCWTAANLDLCDLEFMSVCGKWKRYGLELVDHGCVGFGNFFVFRF